MALEQKMVPAGNWATQTFLGPQIVLIDRVDNRIGAWNGQRYVAVTPASLTQGAAATGIPVGTLLQDPSTGLVYGQADGAGGVEPVYPFDPADNPAFASQFRVNSRVLPTRRIVVTATGLVHLGPCAVVGVHCLATGSAGTAMLDDGVDASVAAQRRFTAAYNASGLAAGTYYPQVLDRTTARLFATGAYFTNTTSGAWALDVIDGTDVPGVEGSGSLYEVAYVSASGLVSALTGDAYIGSIQLLAPGSAGSLIPYDDTAATAGRELDIARAYNAGSMTVNAVFDIRGRISRALYLTLPTSGVVAINYLPR